MVARSQLRHDREERAKDRALQSKRDRLFGALEFANEAMRSITKLGNAECSIGDVAAEFNKAIAGLSASGGVASLEVMARGRDLVGECGRLLLRGMAKRRRLDNQPRDGADDWVVFGDWIVGSQVELELPYSRFLAAVRRDLGIEGASDREVLASITVEMDPLKRAAAEAFAVLQSR